MTVNQVCTNCETIAQEETEVTNPDGKKTNAFAVRAKNIRTNEHVVLKTFFDFRHTAAEDFADEMRQKYDDLPLDFQVASAFYKCWSCGDYSTDERFLTKDVEGNRVCHRCDKAPEIPREVWKGNSSLVGEKAKQEATQ